MTTDEPSTPARTAHHPPTSRWSVRVESISDCVDQLGRIWSTAAEQAEGATLTDDAREAALGDPHFSGRLDPHGSVRVRMRTSVLTLVVVAPRPETTERTLAAINALHARHPSRVIIVSPGDHDGPAALDARIHAECKLSERTGGEICTEQILIKTGGELSQHLSRVITPLLIHDLPTVLWWPDDPAFGSDQFQQVVGMCDRLLVDSGTFRDDGTRRLAGLAAAVAERVQVVDIGWLRLRLWRELFAGLFDHPLLTPELEHVNHVRIDIARPATSLRLPKAAYLCGWLAAALNWQVARPLAAVDERGEVLSGAWRRGRREIEVEVRATHLDVGEAARTAGSLQRVEVEAGTSRTHIRARISRQRDHLLATAQWNGAQVARRAGRLEPFEEAPYVAEALERIGADHVFEKALLRAVRFVGG
jgi:glucose-6-phosphate dehydrogenase assembly protein OpcA